MQGGNGLPTKNDVLSILENARGHFVSGQELAEQLKLSRTAVWKAVRCLEEDGHHITALKNKGYMLEADSDRLSAQAIKIWTSEKYADMPVTLFESTDSTNTQAKLLALHGAAHGTLILAEEQLSGRGRSGKSFYSPRGAGLYMSVILKPEKNAAAPQMITLAAAVAACLAIEKLTGRQPQIKWVNDLYLDGKKICGILTEAVTDFESGGIESIVVGIGVDCSVDQALLPPELINIVGSLDVKGLSRSRLAAEIYAGIMESFDAPDNAAVIEAYKKRSLMKGKHILFQQGDVQLSAVVTGINNLGGLLVRLENGEDMVLSSGEVTIKSLMG